MDFCYPHPLYKFLVSLNLTHYLLGGRILHSYMCVPNVGPLGRTRLGFTTYLYGGFGFPNLGSSQQSDSMRSLYSLSPLFFLYFIGDLSTIFFFLQLLIFIATQQWRGYDYLCNQCVEGSNIVNFKWILGESGFGNGSHFSRHARRQYSLRDCLAHRRRGD